MSYIAMIIISFVPVALLCWLYFCAALDIELNVPQHITGIYITVVDLKKNSVQEDL